MLSSSSSDKMASEEYFDCGREMNEDMKMTLRWAFNTRGASATVGGTTVADPRTELF